MSATGVLFVVAGIAAKSAILLALALIVVRLAPGGARRHAVAVAAMCGALLVPAFSLLLPRWNAPLPTVAAVVPFVGAVAELHPASRAVAMPTGRGASAPETSTRLIVPVAALIVWIAGSLSVLVVVAAGQRRLRRSSARGRALSHGSLVLRDAISRKLGLRGSPRVVAVEGIGVPAVWGAWRSVVIVPAEFDSWPVERRRAVLAHELLHVARGDCLIEYGAWLLGALYWFNPLAWLLIGRLRASREQACDDLVVSMGTSAAQYAGHLVDVAAFARTRPWDAPAAIAFARRGHGALESRIRRILDGAAHRTPLTRMARLTVSGSVLGAAVAIATVSPAVQAAFASAMPAAQYREDIPIAPRGSVARVMGMVAGDTVLVRTAMGDVLVDSSESSSLELIATRLTGPAGEHVDTRILLERRGRMVVVCTRYLTGATVPCDTGDDWGRGSVDENFVSYRLRVPAGVHVRLQTGLGDLITASCVRGDVFALTGNGDANVCASGTTDARSLNGIARKFKKNE